MFLTLNASTHPNRRFYQKIIHLTENIQIQDSKRPATMRSFDEQLENYRIYCCIRAEYPLRIPKKRRYPSKKMLSIENFKANCVFDGLLET
jgi:hypothetical protein